MEEACAVSQVCEWELHGCSGLRRTRADDCGLCPHPAYQRRLCLQLSLSKCIHSIFRFGVGNVFFLCCPGTVMHVLWLGIFIPRSDNARLGQQGHSVCLALGAFSLVSHQVLLSHCELPCRSHLKQLIYIINRLLKAPYYSQSCA